MAISPGSIPSLKVLLHLFSVGILPAWLSQLGLQSQLVRAQLATFKHAGCSLSSLDKVNRGGKKKHFGLLCTWLFVWEGKEDMRRKTLIPKTEKVAKHLVVFECEGEESSQTAECSWFRISCWMCFRKLFLSQVARSSARIQHVESSADMDPWSTLTPAWDLRPRSGHGLPRSIPVYGLRAGLNPNRSGSSEVQSCMWVFNPPPVWCPQWFEGWTVVGRCLNSGLFVLVLC